jgi:hypothetical protein
MNKHDLKVGDKVTFINKLNTTIIKTITRIEFKSVYSNNCRESWNTVNDLIDNYNATIIRN